MVKVLSKTDFKELNELYYQYNKCLVIEADYLNSTAELVDLIKTSVVFGLFIKGKLVGFTIGKGISRDIFHFSAMYIIPNKRYYMKQLFTKSEALIKEVGYSGFTSESSTKEGINMHNKMGCNPIEIKFYKEI